VVEPSKIEIDWTLKQLEALGQIKFSNDRTSFRLTDKGMERAAQLLQRSPLDERILIGLFTAHFVRSYLEG